MAIQVALHHVTRYRYERPIQLGAQTIRLRPAPHCRSPILSYSLKIQPAKHFLNWQQDPFGNYLARAVFPEKVKEFVVEVDLVTEVHVFNPFDFFLEEYAFEFPFRYEPWLAEELAPYLVKEESGPLLESFVKSVDRKKQNTVDFLVGANSQVYNALKYLIRMEPGVQTCEETLSLKSGSCRDMAWLLCQVLRHFGLATRFTSGYLIQLASDIKSLDGPSGPEQDFTDLHAWTEVYLPGAGWVGMDPTSGLLAGEGHIPLCCTPKPSSAAPVTGTLEACESTLEHTMSITRIREDRRVTRPYSDGEWEAIGKLGEQVDADLEENDVRLTMGGEPTFVSLDDREGSEWKFDALGDKKKELAETLFLKLSGRFSRGALLHFGQGKWYPGEQLPRWSMACFWRKDGEPVWNQAEWLAARPQDRGHDMDAARRFIGLLATRLHVPGTCVLPAHEDAVYYLWKEQKLPVEGDIFKADLHEKTERRRLQKLLEGNLNAVAGYVLPLAYAESRERWVSNRWAFQSKRLTLTIGDSPVGFRLPLDSLPQVPESRINEELGHGRSVFQTPEPLPAWEELAQIIEERKQDAGAASVGKGLLDAPAGLVRTALCVEPRGGQLYVFLPPVHGLSHYLELIASVESVAGELKMPVVIEGYEPPHDSALQHFRITPDPGVIEVNVHPAHNWQELNEIIGTVYEEAYKGRLVADKFLIDGRRVGTGGGNHIIAGGATPADSPFLRRPDLLRSFITFWQNHPSLSYLFSAMFIGPTSQFPRVDEARMDSLYDLDIAFSEMSRMEEPPLWMVDRLLRNLMVDVTGNTHRAEICIDKLYSPDGDRGRLGLLELRGFEMSPHPRMNLVQALLVRTLIAHFWKTPYREPLVRWGTRLHDQFMLPHFVWEDFQDVLYPLQAAGYPFKAEWFEPFLEFRFPKYGRVQVGPFNLELSMALEPWPVLGEEATRGGVSRSVDSAMERLQIRVENWNDAHYAVSCNGLRVPLKPTGQPGVYVAGVRFKAWSPASSLHPTIPAQGPLIFDVVDLRYGRSIGGCTYHVGHPGGRNYESIPLNENEAQGRRLSRFQAMGHTPGPQEAPKQISNPEFPCTLDLRFKRMG